MHLPFPSCIILAADLLLEETLYQVEDVPGESPVWGQDGKEHHMEGAGKVPWLGSLFLLLYGLHAMMGP